MLGENDPMLAELVWHLLDDPGAGWSIGTLGAIAEFSIVVTDPPGLIGRTPTGARIVTDRGALAVHLVPEVRAVAYEGLGGHTDGHRLGWTQAIAFCLPRAASATGRRSVLTEIGADTDALRPEDRHRTLFDLGVDAPHMDFCVRTDDAALIRRLRQAAGRPIAGAGDPVLEAIKEASPQRVCLSRLGRVEVYQPIALRRLGRMTPQGPHTHLLPDLLRRRAHCGQAAIPRGWVSALDHYPASPIAMDDRPREEFDADRHLRYQSLLERFGQGGYLEEKVLVTAAVLAGVDPARYAAEDADVDHTAARIALRQMLHTHPGVVAVHDWLAALEPVDGAAGDGSLPGGTDLG